jgi:hypothetical protein
MSHNITDAIIDQNSRIDLALETRDSEALYQIAEEVKEQGEDELAETLLASAKRIDREDWSYDAANNN